MGRKKSTFPASLRCLLHQSFLAFKQFLCTDQTMTNFGIFEATRGKYLGSISEPLMPWKMPRLVIVWSEQEFLGIS